MLEKSHKYHQILDLSLYKNMHNQTTFD